MSKIVGSLKKKGGLKKIKDEYGETKNKIAFEKEHAKDLVAYNKINRVQGRLNEHTKTINRLKKLPETKNRKLKISSLEEIKTNLMTKYLTTNL